MSRKALFFSLSISVAAGAGMVACGGGNDAAPVASSPAPAPGPTPTPAPAPTPTPTPTPAPAPSPPSPPPPPPPAAPFEINVQTPPPPTSSGVSPKLTLFATGLSTPWSMAFLPDGRLLVTQKPGQLRLISADGTTVSAPISGVPTVDARDQGGLLDVAIDPQFAANRRVYLTFSEPVVAGSTNRTAVARGELSADATALQNVSVIFRQATDKQSTLHFGSRIVFRPDGTMFVTLGERAGFASEAQSLTSLLGKVVRINTDGTIPADNPNASSSDAATRAVWSYGHRNPQAAALHPATGELWVAEHGPQGGDEVNVALPMRNFGWPNVSYGCNYGDPQGTACRINGGTHNAPYTPPAVFWYPISTAPGGALFYTGGVIPQWQGALFVGGLAGKTLWRLVINGQSVIGQEPFFTGQHEIRDLKQGPDGKIYLISRNTSQIFRVDP